jgi:superfamily II DNA or RNA helicase
MNALRTYQQDIYARTREAMRNNRSVAVQLHTGGGKTVIFTAICESIYGKNKRAWIIVPRKELLRQASEHLRKWNVPHGIIDAGNQESRAYQVHVISKDTLIRRMDKIKNFPDVVIFDECHLFIDRQKKIIEALPETTKIIGYSATPERLDSRGLSTRSGGVYDVLIEGPSIPWLTERGFLVPLRYFSPPLDGIDKIKVNNLGEYDEESLEELLQRRKVYGDLVTHFERHGKGKAALIFCRSVKSAHQAAERFRDKGHNFVAIDGTMPDGQVKAILEAHRAGKIEGVTNCLLATYGVDIPRVEYIGDISPTMSLSMYMQKIGRGLRPFPGKTDLIYMDHVNQVLNHQDDRYPGIPLHYVPEIKWNFDGATKRKRKKTDRNIVLCPHLDYFYCPHGRCATCEHNPDRGQQADQRKPMVVIPADLQEIPKAVPLNQRLPEERREIQDQIGQAVLEHKAGEMSAVEKLLKIADSLGYREMWVYHRLTEESRFTVNIPVLSEIARVRGYKPGWVYMAKLKLKGVKG